MGQLHKFMQIESFTRSVCGAANGMSPAIMNTTGVTYADERAQQQWTKTSLNLQLLWLPWPDRAWIHELAWHTRGSSLAAVSVIELTLGSIMRKSVTLQGALSQIKRRFQKVNRMWGSCWLRRGPLNFYSVSSGRRRLPRQIQTESEEKLIKPFHRCVMRENKQPKSICIFLRCAPLGRSWDDGGKIVLS